MNRNTRRYPKRPAVRPNMPIVKAPEPRVLSRAEQLRALIATKPPGVIVIEINDTVPTRRRSQ